MAGEPELGETIAGYVLEAPLGRGSTSQVYVGRHRALGRRAAIKVLALSIMDNADVRKRMIQEARAAAEIRHPHIAAVWDFHESAHPPRLALVMELVEGPSLKILRGAPLDPRRAREAALQLLGAVDAAHRVGIIHRDLKADNLLFARDPRPPAVEPHLMVVDFGIAKRVSGGGMVHTAAGAMLGTPAYMAPEQISGRSPPSFATDVYAVAELVYELFTGERAFAEEISEEVLQQKLRGRVPELPLPAPLAAELQDVLRSGLDPDPARRPTLGEIRQALERLGAAALAIPAGATVLAPPPPRPVEGPDTPWVTRPGGRVRRELAMETSAVSAEEVRRVLKEEDRSDPTSSPRVIERDTSTEPGWEDDDEDDLATAIAEDETAALPVVSPSAAASPSTGDAVEAPAGALRRPRHVPPEADSVLRPLDVRRAMRVPSTVHGSGPGTREDVVDEDAETVPPEGTPGFGSVWGWALALAGILAAIGLAAWLQ